MTDSARDEPEEAEPESDPKASEPSKKPPRKKQPEQRKPTDKKSKQKKTAKAPPVPGLVSNRIAYGLAIFSGFLYFLAFPGVDLWPLGFVALAPLFVALRGQPPKRALFIGWLAGFTMTMCGFYWLLEMLKTFSGFPLPLCLLFMSILCAYQAGRIGLMGWLHARIENRGWAAPLAFALAFAASEQVFPLLFPWSYAATVHQLPILLQLGDLGGPILVGLVLVAFNMAVAELVVARLEKRVPHYKLAGALGVPLAVALIYGAIRIPQVDARVREAPKARVGLVQANMSLLAKRREKSEGLKRHLDLTRELQAQAPLDLVVWSETSVMAPQNEDVAPELYRNLFASSLKVPAIFGAVLVREVPDARGYVLFNSALLTDAAGDVTGRYDKQFLLAFGEYLPFGETFPSLYEISKNSGRFTPGKTLKPLPLGDHEIATFICYEDIIPGFVRSIVKSGNPDLLVNMTNDAWFGNTTEPWIHLALAKLRAVEHRRFFVRSTNSGVSAFIDPVGRVMSNTRPFEKEAQAQEVAWMRSTTGYGIWGDWPWWLVSAAAFVLAFVQRQKPSRRRQDPDTAPKSLRALE